LLANDNPRLRASRSIYRIAYHEFEVDEIKTENKKLKEELKRAIEYADSTRSKFVDGLKRSDADD